MSFYQPAANQEPQPDSFNSFTYGIFQTLEGLKEFGLILGGYAHTLVVYAHDQALLFGSGGNSYFASSRRIFNRVL